jgi:YidC/Oxa1 family membrane protein insertase
MDQKRLFTAILISIAILLGYQLVARRYLPQPPEPTAQSHQSALNKTATPPEGGPAAGAPAAPAAPAPANVPRLKIAAPAVRGSVNLRGARIDDVILNDYRQTDAPNSPDVQLLEPASAKNPYFVQYGWSAPAGETVALPGEDTVWSASAPELQVGRPVTLSWNNGQGLDFHLVLSIDEHYMLSVRQEVRNGTGQPVKLYPWARVRRDYTPETAGYYILFEGLLGVADGRLQEYKYSQVEADAKKQGSDVAYSETSTGGWAGITDKYWLTAIIPDQAVPETVRFRYIPGGDGHYQVDYVTQEPQTVAPGADTALPTHLFAGAKVVTLLDRYERELHIPHFDKAVDFGWFYFLTKPIFYCLDFLNGLLGNFGLAIIVFTVFVKILFFPLANYSYRSMSKMRLLSPKVTALRERFKDDPQKMQAEMMALYKAERVNPASGCLPMVVQIPVFFSLYKVIFVTIEMRQAPFFGWIRDLSQIDPTNIFTLFGLIPWDPGLISPILHVGVWPLIMGLTMFFQQKLNPPPPDPTQAKLFMFMPVIFTFMLARFPAGLVIYWSWNNLLSIAQQWLIMRRTHLTRPGLART